MSQSDEQWAQLAREDPVTVATFVVRAQVRGGMVTPRLAALSLASKLGISVEVAAEQLVSVGGLPDEATRFLTGLADKLRR